MTTTILAGQVVHIDRTFTRADPNVSVVGTTVKIAVTDAAGVTTALTGETVTNPTADTVRVVANWASPASMPRQLVTLTFESSVALVDAAEETIFVNARRLVTVP